MAAAGTKRKWRRDGCRVSDEAVPHPSEAARIEAREDVEGGRRTNVGEPSRSAGGHRLLRPSRHRRLRRAQPAEPMDHRSNVGGGEVFVVPHQRQSSR